MTMNWDDWEKTYLSGGGTTTTPTTPPPGAPKTFTQSAIEDKTKTNSNLPGYATKDALLAQGGKQLGAGTIFVGNDKYSLEAGTGLYRFYGQATAADRAAIGQQMMNQGQANRTGTTTAGITPEARPYAGNAGTFGTVGPGQGPTIPGFDAFRQPGIGVPSEGRQTIGGISNGLNAIQAGRQGSATQFPVTPGFRGPTDYGNNINFANGNSAGANPMLEPQMRFADTSVSVPGTYVFGQGNVNDSNRAYSVPFNIGGGGAALMNIAGNNVQLSSADKGTGYGFALNAMPASNVGALTGRNLSEDPASQAAQVLMLNSAIAQGRMGDLMATNPNQFGGNRAGTGNGPFSGNGGMGQGTFWSGYTPDPIGQLTGPTTPPIPMGGPTSGDTTPPGGITYDKQFGPAFGSNTQATAGAVGNSALATIPTGGGGPTFGPAFANDQQVAAAYAAWAAAQAQAEKDRQAGGGYGDYSVDNRGFAGGGMIRTVPLGGPVSTPKSMVTNGPKYLIDAKTGKIEALMGEDNADPGYAPNKERLTFSGPHNSMLHITPLQPYQPRRFDGGGDVQLGDAVGRMAAWEDYLREIGMMAPPPANFVPSVQLDPSQIIDMRGAGLEDIPLRSAGTLRASLNRFAGGGFIQTQQAPPPPMPYLNRVPSPNDPFYQYWMNLPHAIGGGAFSTGLPFASGGTITTNATEGQTTDPTPDPLDPNILAPWQQEQQANAQRQAVRDNYSYRNKFAGVNGPTAVEVLQGNAPTNELAPNMYYSTDKQVNNTINSILGAQEEIRALGPAINTDPIYGEIGTIGTQLDAQQRLRDMATTKAGLEAQNEAEKAQALMEYNASSAEIAATQNALEQAQYIFSVERTPEAQQSVLNLQAKMQSLQANANQLLARSQGDSPALIALRAQEQALQGTLGPNWSEAGARTKLAQLQTQISNNDQRIKKGVEVANLAKLNVPKLNGPIMPVTGAAA